jgi:DNA polymerase-4
MHADLDAFYASVEQLLDPSLRGRPIAVGGGVVLAASYEARGYGVHAGMAGWQARRLCPGLRFVGGHFGDYQRLADRVIEVLKDFTPWVERISIDEAFLDVSGSLHLFGPARTVAATIRSRVRDEIGLPLSIGVAGTKHLAKVASQVAKPDGLVVVEPGWEQAFLRPLPVELMWGVGPVTQQMLASRGIRTIGQLAATEPKMIEHLIGHANGNKLARLSHDLDPRHVEGAPRARSVGAQAALGRRVPTPELVAEVIAHLADRVAPRLRAAGRAGRTITVRVRFAGMKSVTRSTTLARPLSSTRTLTELGERLVATALADHAREAEISLLAVSVSNLVAEAALQLELPFDLEPGVPRPGSVIGSARWAVDRSVDAVRSRFGREAVGYARPLLAGMGFVSDEFRELAQHELRDSAAGHRSHDEERLATRHDVDG